LGFGLMVLSSAGSSKPSTNAVAAARCPPADPPPAASRSGSMPSFAALARTQRMADLASATQAKGSTPWLFFVRYSTAIATIPREAR